LKIKKLTEVIDTLRRHILAQESQELLVNCVKIQCGTEIATGIENDMGTSTNPPYRFKIRDYSQVSGTQQSWWRSLISDWLTGTPGITKARISGQGERF
jgi:hypothetical protein